MAVKVKLAPARRIGIGHRVLRAGLLIVLIVVVIAGVLFGYEYLKYEHVVEDRLAAGPIFANVSQIYAAPREVRVGQRLTASFIAQDLRRAGYNANPQLGTFELNGDSITIKPGPQSYHSTDSATIVTGMGSGASDSSQITVQSITSENGAALAAYQLEPQLITALSEDKNRTKRRLVTYKEIPPDMVQAVLAIEDRRFFDHHGVNYPPHDQVRRA